VSTPPAAVSSPATAPVPPWVTRGAAFRQSVATATAYVDGQDAFAKIAADISDAKQFIYFTGWAVWAEVPLLRSDSHKTLLDVLGAKTRAGLDVRAILWHSPGPGVNTHEEEALDRLGRIGVACFRHRPYPPWANHLKTIAIDGQVAWVGGIDLWHGRYDTAAHPVFDLSGPYLGDWYNTTLRADWQGYVRPAPDSPRMPWHDVHCRLEGDAASAVAVSFITRWNNTYVMGHSHDRSDDSKHVTRDPLKRSVTPRGGGSMDVQILRSLGSDNGGDEHQRTERSILTAYVNAIQTAQHFIYIENQFFISKVGKEQTPVNLIMQTLAARIEQALAHRERFLVVMVVPTVLDGKLNDDPVKGQLRWMTRTIGHGYDQRPKANQKPADLSFTDRVGTAYAGVAKDELPASVSSEQSYLGVFTLRAAAKAKEIGTQWTRSVGPMPPQWAGQCLSEQVYVHAKTMIVDDRVVIIGSANLNDRSLLGDRDSEMCAMIVDNATIAITMDEADYGYANRFAHDLRVRLWAEHLGQLEQGKVPDNVRAELADPITAYDHCWLPTAKKNRATLEQVFANTMPTDAQMTIDDRSVFVRTAREPEPGAVDLEKDVHGHVTEFPLGWLSREPFKLGTVTNIVSNDSWFQ
jgi:phospholipase D1/2